MKAWRFLTIMLTVVSAGAALAHLLELPAKLAYSGRTWLHLLQTLYPPWFGPVGGSCEIAAVIAALVLVVRLRRRGERWGWSAVAAAALLVTHAIFWIWVWPVNATLLPLSAETLPADWTRLRDQWEYAHATRAVLQLIALAAFVLSLLVALPGAPRPSRPPATA